MTKSGVLNSVVAESPATAKGHVATAGTVAKLELGGDEIVQLSIKPSLWFIPRVSFNALLLAAFVAVAVALAMRSGVTPVTALPFQVLTALAAARVGVATLQWASRLYVLTNRRVMRFKGVLSVNVAECPLARICAVDVQSQWGTRLVRIGTIRMQPADGGVAVITWDDIARPEETHELLVRAIRKAQSRD